MPLPLIQQRLHAILDLATQHLPERPQPVCEGTWLDPDTVHVGQYTMASHTILCPKRHIGPNIADLVHVDRDCLKNPCLCHVIGQPIVPPFVVRVTTQEQLVQQSHDLRVRSEEPLRRTEAEGDSEGAESLRQHIFTGIGRAVEQYVKLFANTSAIESTFESWIFGEYWKRHRRSLDEQARNALVSGEYVWQHYQEATLHDWAAPAIQYCRALEHELHRRCDVPLRGQLRLSRAGFTLGTISYAYNKRDREGDAAHNWALLTTRVQRSGASVSEFTAIVERLDQEQVQQHRNGLAHGGSVNHTMASALRASIIGDKHIPGILCWLVEHIEPFANDERR